MRNSIFIILLALITINMTAQDKEGIQWLSWADAQAKMAEEPKDMFIDMYTDWCGWCKRMDATTFKDPAVVDFINKNFYAVKFDAEQKEAITYQGFEFKFVNSGRRGYHQLAHSMLNGRMGYPAFVYFNENMERIMISPGYKKAEQILGELEFASKDMYKTMELQEYLKTRA